MLKHILFYLTFTSAFVGFSQLTYLNPFSSYGIGNQILPSDAIQYAMGGSSIAYFDSTMVSQPNSASLASITTDYPLFSLGITGKYSQFTEGTSSFSRAFASLDHMIFAVPFRKRFGVSFGLVPYARRGYEFQKTELYNLDSVTFEYAGKGSIGKGFMGLSWKVLQTQKIQLSLGTNLGYLFGTTTNSRKSSVVGSGASGLSLQSDRLQSFHYDFSLMGSYAFKKGNMLRLTAFYEPAQSLNGRFADELFYVSSGGSVTLISSTNTSATFQSASSLRVGANYSLNFKRLSRKNKPFNSELTFVGEYNQTDFSKFNKNYGSSEFTAYSYNYTRVSFGVQYVPNTSYYRSVNPTGFFNKLKYRAGSYTSSLPYNHNGSQFAEFGTTFGIGLPLVSSSIGNTFSSMNFGVDIGKRASTATGALNENYWGFNIGIIIAPSKADHWFRKVKLD